MDLPEVALVNVLARFPLKSIANFRIVSKQWKSLLDSDFFRDHYISFNCSVSWSIIQTKPHKLSLEIVGHHGCERWGLSRSPGSFMSFFAETTITKLLVLSCTDGLVSIFAENINGSPLYYVGNPLLKEWIRIPLPPFLSVQVLHSLDKNERFNDTGLVTKMQSGIVVSYKIVWMFRPNFMSDDLDFMIYSSETAMWKKKKVRCTCLRPAMWSWSRHDKSIALNGILHWLSQDIPIYDANSVVAYDFYGAHDEHECRVIHFPSKDDEIRRFRRIFTTSGGSIVYFNEFHEDENLTLRVWKLVKYTDCPEAWQLSWEINLWSFKEFGRDYFPVVMHPLNMEIIYLWSRNKKCLILLNLRTHVFSLHEETADENKSMDDCILSFNGCREYMDNMFRYYLHSHQCLPNHLFFSQYVLPRWLHHLPCPQST